MKVRSISSRTAALVVTLSLLLAVFAVSLAPAPAQAAAASCSAGRCTVTLSNFETRLLAKGRVPAPPVATPYQLKVAYYALAHGHRWFASQYASRGWCSGFRLSSYPWESQGYFGYAC